MYFVQGSKSIYVEMGRKEKLAKIIFFCLKSYQIKSYYPSKVSHVHSHSFLGAKVNSGSRLAYLER